MSYQSEVLADSPLLYLRLDETSGSTCANTGSLGGNATATGTFTRNVAGGRTDLGVAVSLGGTTSDYVSYPDTASLDITGDVTYECWVRYPVIPGTAAFLMSKGGDSGSVGGYALRIAFPSTNQIQVLRSGIAVLASTAPGVNPYPTDAAWHHVAFTRSGNNYIIYLDGASAFSGSSATAVQATTKAFYVGVENNSAGFSSPSAASIDEVAVYNTALSGARILAHYTAAGSVPGAPGAFVPRVAIIA